MLVCWNTMQWSLSLLFKYHFLIEIAVGFTPPFSSFSSEEMKNLATKDNTPLQPCNVCDILVESFRKGMQLTSRGKYDGGDAHWEESRLGSYANSEVRLVEIQEQLCADIKTGQVDCHHLAEEHESILEDWWFHHRDVELHQYFCIDKLKVCCLPNHYGPECKPCSLNEVPACSDHGSCNGNGTRKGNGKCKCHTGYKGEICDQCDVGYFRDDTNGNWICAKCHESCKGHCRGPEPLGCEMCAEGYHHEPQTGCTDDDECISSPCEPNTFCVNVIGSYKCQHCHSSCNLCTGEGPYNCVECAKDHIMKNGKCTGEVDDEFDEEDDSSIEDNDVSTENPSTSAGHEEL